MNKYIGTKIVGAEPMTRGSYNEYRGWDIPAGENPDDEGYMTKYSDNYVSWCPKDTFEKSYLRVDENPNLPSGISVGPKMVEDFIKEIHVQKIGNKTTLVRAVLVNGFEIIESSACVDASNYNQDIGTDVCMKKIKDKIWQYLGFLLQTAYSGIQ